MGVRLGWSKGTPKGVRGRRVVVEEHGEPYNKGLYSVMVYGRRGLVDGKIGCSPLIARNWKDRFERMIREGRPFYVDLGDDEKKALFPRTGRTFWDRVCGRG